jgi:hypothetical protein
MHGRAAIIATALLGLLVCAGLIAFVVPDKLHELNRPVTRDAPAAAAERGPAARASAPPASPDAGGVPWRFVALWTAGWSVAGLVGAAGLAGWIVRRRLRHRLERDYRLYELHLSMHDEAKPQDVEEMVEAIANVVRQFPEDRVRDGQPYVAFELHHGPGARGELEWTIAVRCESRLVTALDAALAAAYPDVRVGHRHGEAPTPLAGTLPRPGFVLRYRKARPFVYTLSSQIDRREGSPPIEAIARAQAALGKPSSVRIQLTPAPLWIEDYARRRFQRHENKLVRAESWGAAEAGLRGSLNKQEMTAAKRTQNRSMFWLELQVAADSREDANRIGSAVQASRGDNRLHRRWIVWPYRLRLYRERFPTAYPPLWPPGRYAAWPRPPRSRTCSSCPAPA